MCDPEAREPAWGLPVKPLARRKRSPAAQSEPIAKSDHGDDSIAVQNPRRMRRYSMSSAGTVITLAPLATTISSAVGYSPDGIFAVRDGANVTASQRPRRRTGPLTQLQRARARIIRRLGACPDCRRKRVAVSFCALKPCHLRISTELRTLTLASAMQTTTG